ncbi:hypothetical protein LC724_33075 [Blautia sp. RD014234]|nr:hypothetical protein [Blautia parvula]
MEEYERPISPLLFVTLDHASGMVLDMKMVNPEESEIDVVLDFFVDYLQNKGRMLRIKARNPWVFAAIQDICRECGIQLVRDEMEEMDRSSVRSGSICLNIFDRNPLPRAVVV